MELVALRDAAGGYLIDMSTTAHVIEAAQARSKLRSGLGGLLADWS